MINKSRSSELLIEYLGSLKGGVGIAFSGGLDSTYLLRIAREVCLGQVLSFLLVSPFLSSRERSWAHGIADGIGMPLMEVPWHPLDFHCIRENGSSRCYYCKYAMYNELWSVCREHEILNLLDGTQLDDLKSDRPGIKAIQELSVKIPLVYCNLNKNNIRRLSNELSLPTWDRPSYSCLATRVVTGTFITKNLIEKIEAAEEFLTYLQMKNTKLSVKGNIAYLEVSEEERPDLEEKWKKIKGFLQNMGFYHLYMREKVNL